MKTILREHSRVVVVAAVLAVLSTVGPAVGHTGTPKHLWAKHLRPLADARYYLQGQKVANSNQLDGKDSGFFSPRTHNHDEAYSALGHRHDGIYAAANHSHDGTYASLNHNHDGVYAPVSHNHDGAYAPVTHAHSGADINTGTVAEARIDALVARDGEIMPTVLANDGPSSGLNADTVDGFDSSTFFRGQIDAGTCTQPAASSGTVTCSFNFTFSSPPFVTVTFVGVPELDKSPGVENVTTNGFTLRTGASTPACCSFVFHYIAVRPA